MTDETNTAEEQETILDQQTSEWRGVRFTLTLVKREHEIAELRGEVPALVALQSKEYAGYDHPLDDEELIGWPYEDDEKSVTIEDNVSDDTTWLVENYCRTAIAWALEGARRQAERRRAGKEAMMYIPRLNWSPRGYGLPPSTRVSIMLVQRK